MLRWSGLLLLLLGGLLWWSAAAPGWSDAGTGGFAGGRAEVQDLEAAAEGGAARADEDAERRQLGTRAQVGTEPTGSGIVLLGSCVEATSGAPIAGLPIRLGVYLSGLDELPKSAPAFTPPPPTRTDARGHFRFEFRATRLPLRVIPEQDWAPSDGFDYEGVDPTIEGGNVYQLEPFELEPGFRVAGRVIDQEGRPIDREYLSMANHWTSLIREGRFDLGLLSAGSHSVEMPSDGHEVVDPQELEVGPGLNRSAVLIRVHSFPSLRARVVDAQGRPVAGMLLEALIDNESHCEARTDAAGCLIVRSNSLRPGFVRFQSSYEFAPQGRLADAGTWHPIPGPEVLLRIDPWLQCAVRVRWSRGQPVEDYDLVTRDHDELQRLGEIREGLGRFTGLQGRDSFVRVVPKGLRGLRSEPHRVAAGLQPGAVTEIVLEERVLLQVEVKTRIPMKERFYVGYRNPAKPQDTSPVNRWGRIGRPERIPVHRDGVGGRLVVRVRELTREHVLDAADLSRGRVQIDLSEVEFPDRCTLSIRLKSDPPQLATRQFARNIRLRKTGAEKFRPQHGLVHRQLEAGDWEVWWVVDHRVWPRPDRSVRVTEPPRLLRRLRLAPGEKRVAEITLDFLETGKLQGRLLHHGQPIAGRRVRLIRTDGQATFRAWTDAQGLFRSRPVLAGEYRVSVAAPPLFGLTTERQIPFPQRVSVGAGETAEQVFDTAGQRLTLRFRDANGQILAQRWFYVWQYGPVRSDDRGEVLLDPAPIGTLFIAHRPAPGQDRRWIEVPASRRLDGRAEVRL